MRKHVLRILMTGLLLSFILTGCGKDEAVIKAQNDIDAIGEVTAENINTVNEVYSYYNSLSEEQKAKVENADALISAKQSADELTKKIEEEKAAEEAAAKAAELEKLINDGKDLYYGLNGTTADHDKALETFLSAEEYDSADAYYYAGRIQDEKENYDEAKASYEKAIELGNSMAKFALGLMYQSGDGVEQDYAMAKSLYEEAIADGCIEANAGMGDIYQSGYGEEKDASKAVEYFNLAVTGEENEWQAYSYASLCFMNNGNYEGIEKNEEKIDEYGNKVNELTESWTGKYLCWVGNAFLYAKNQEKAAEYCKKANDINDLRSMADIGMLYYNLGDNDKALDCFKRSAEIESGNGMGMLGNFYANGLGVEQDYQEAIKWYQKAIDAGEKGWANLAGMICEEGGYGLDQDVDKAIEYYTIAADAGSDAALHNLGVLYYNGINTTRDFDRAFEWFMKAAENGYANSMAQVAYMYWEGLGVEQDYSKAFEWNLKAAEAGNAQAMHELSVMYHDGIGIDVDLDKANEWKENAKAAGYKG